MVYGRTEFLLSGYILVCLPGVIGPIQGVSESVAYCNQGAGRVQLTSGNLPATAGRRTVGPKDWHPNRSERSGETERSPALDVPALSGPSNQIGLSSPRLHHYDTYIAKTP